MTRKPKILITNDDGIHATGIKYLWEYLKEIADVTVIAPAVDQTAVGLGITLRHPLSMQKITWENEGVWSVTGTPADCVKLALNTHFTSPPDLIVSGINKGTNSGRNLLYSGTVAGAIEAIMHDIPAIAFSCHDIINPDYTIAKPFVANIVTHVLNHPLPKGTLLNVNFPHCEEGEVQGVKLTRQGKEVWMEAPEKRIHPAASHSYFWLGAKLVQFEEEEEESDIVWLRKKYVTAVPVHVHELTDFKHLQEHKEHFELSLSSKKKV